MVKTVHIRLHSSEAVKSFCQIIGQCVADFELESRRYTVNPKSLMGIYTLDLANPLTLRIRMSEPLMAQTLKNLEPYICS